MGETTGEQRPAKQAGLVKSFVAGGFGGVCNVLVGYPLDTIKVRLQTQPKPSPGEPPLYTSAVDCTVKTIRNEGIRGLYKGMASPLVGVTPIFAISFYGYEFGKKIQRRSADGGNLTLPQISIAGFISGMFSTTVMVPFERVKCVMQVQRNSGHGMKYKGSLDCAIKLYQEGGIRSSYRGVGATLLRDVPATGAYFGVYEFLLRRMTPEGKTREHLHPLSILFAGGMAGVFFWVVAIVPDTLKSRLQTAPEGMFSGVFAVYRNLMKHEGPKALFKGVGPIMLRSFPANAACFLGFEVAMKALNDILP